MSLLRYLPPFRSLYQSITQLRRRVDQLKAQRNAARAERDAWKGRYKEAHAANKLLLREANVAPHRCLAAIDALRTGGPPTTHLDPATRLAVLDTVSPLVSPEDDMTWSSQADFYFEIGLSALNFIEHARQLAGNPPPTQILDLPSGHGRVLRFLKARFPAARLTACDLLEDGINFCAANFGATPVLSDPDPAEIDLPTDSFDLIWVGSLVTHLDAPAYRSFLRQFARWLAPGGLLLFTSHGHAAADKAREGNSYFLSEEGHRAMLEGYQQSGFGYADYPKRPGYGVSLSSRAWVVRSLAQEAPQLALVAAWEAAWGGYHDIFVCRRPR